MLQGNCVIPSLGPTKAGAQRFSSLGHCIQNKRYHLPSPIYHHSLCLQQLLEESPAPHARQQNMKNLWHRASDSCKDLFAEQGAQIPVRLLELHSPAGAVKSVRAHQLTCVWLWRVASMSPNIGPINTPPS